MVRLFSNANYKFIELRKLSYIATAIVLSVCVAVAAYNQISRDGWVNYGVDFAGGTLLQLRFNNDMTVGQLRPQIETQFPGTEITRFGEENEFLLRARSFTEDGKSVADQIVAALRETHGDSFIVARTEAVGPKVGAELQSKALLAIILSLGATLIYLAFRFEWRFGLAAVIATSHDLLITLGMIAVLRLEVSLTTVAAVLTIVGYSLNDTIVIFDRIRENLKRAGRRVELIPLLNRSINETLPRTVLTSASTLFALLALAVLGGSTIRGFALIMFFGIVLGTYSSIFVASPVLYEIEKRWGIKPAEKPSRQQKVAL